MRHLNLESSQPSASLFKGEMPQEDLEAAVSETANTVEEEPVTFVDYVLPPQVQVLPPSRYKLWLQVFFGVYFTSWVSSASGFTQACRIGGWLSPSAAAFLMRCIIVVVLLFSAFDLMMLYLNITVKGKVYGIKAWLKPGSRISWHWLHRSQFADWTVVELLRNAIHILEDGFAMLNGWQTFRKPAVESTNINRKGVIGQTNHEDDDDDNDSEMYKGGSEDSQVILKVHLHIKPDAVEQYKKWEKRMTSASLNHLGFLSVRPMDFVPSSPESTEEKATTNAQPYITGSIPSPSQNPPDSLLRVVYLTFQNIESLNSWMTSPRRKSLVKQLQPMLAVPQSYYIQAEQAVAARNAFTNIVVLQGSHAPKLPPKQWKVWWHIMMTLTISSHWVTKMLNYYILNVWGITNVHLISLIMIGASTFISFYITTPFSLFFFDPWLQRQANEVDERWFFKTVNDGIQSIWLKWLVSIAFYGGCIIAIILKHYG